MPKGFYVKVKQAADAYGPSWKTINSMWVKKSTTSWSNIADAWVKVKQVGDAYGSATWKPFYTAGTAPDTAIEILDSTDSSDRLRFQGVNKHWTPNPTTLQYKFVYINPTNSVEQDITSWTNTTNPSTGSSITLPSSTSYVTIANGATDPYWYPGQNNIYQFRVRGTVAAGIYFTFSAEYNFYIPKAPTLTITDKTTTSLKLTITAASQDDYISTNRYIVYAYDGAYRYAGSAGGITGLGGYAATTDPVVVNIGGLVLGKNYTFYVIPITGFSGSTDTNTSGYQGLQASITTSITGPNPPTTFTATTNLSDKVRLNWSGASGSITSYGIYWSTGQLGPTGTGNLNDGTYNADFTVNVNGSTVTTTGGTYDDTAINAGQTRYYWIRSQGPQGNGLWTPTNGGVMGTRVDLKPVNTVLPSITGTIKEGQTVTANAGTWSNTPTSYTYRFGYEVYDSQLGEYLWYTVQEYTGVTSTTQNYTIPANWRSLYGTSMRLWVTATNSSGNGEALSATYTVAVGVNPYTFNFGNTIYVSTNGYISFDSGQTFDSVTSATGRVLAIIPRDLQQNGNLYYWSNSSEYRIKWVGYNFNQSSQPQVYEVTFYNGQQYADVYIENSFSAASTTGAYYNDGTAITNYSAALTTGQARRVYFNTTAPTTVSYTPKLTGIMLQSAITSGTTDQGYTTLTTAANQSAPVPTLITSPSVTPSSGTAGTTQFSTTNGSWNYSPTGYTYQWKYNDQGALWLNITGATSSTYTPPSNYVSLYGSSLRCYVTAINNAGSSTEAQSNTVTVSAPVIPTTPTSLTATTNRTDGVNLTFSGSTNATSYDIFWNTTQGASPSSASTPDFPGVSSPYLDTTISSGTTRYYWVRGKNGTNTSAWYPATNGVTGTRLAAVSNATAPTSVSATGGNGSATVSWSGATNAVKYRIWWSTNSSGNAVDPASSYDAETTSSPYTFTGLSNGSTYYFWVSASNTNNVWTSYSSSPRGQATPSAGVAPSVPGTPTLTYVSSNNTATDYGYSATWSNSTSGTAPISYYLKCYGSSDNYSSVQQTRGPFSTGATAQSFLLPKTSSLWKVSVYATNSAGTSADSGTSGAA